jgi:transcriptional regulator with PAS, ATPase and Fis domain
MRRIIKKLLAYKNLGRIVFDKNFYVSEKDRKASQILNQERFPLPNQSLLDLFPELYGNEEILREILNRKRGEFCLKHIHRNDRDGDVRYLNLLILPGENKETGILILEDSTEDARILQEINQQKYELLLHKSISTIGKQLLSEGILGQSKEIQQVRESIKKISKVPSATVLLLGESGTGKNLAARVIHYSSMPPDAPIVDINCAAIPENLIESELFGYEKGAFTHATTTKMGLFEGAEGGTIFLDEIAELPLNLQVKLLDVLETKKFRRLGSNKSLEVKARIIAATNRDIQQEVLEGRFRSDLFYRLNVVSITLPPLRKMGEDILIIANHFLNIYNIEFKKNIKGFTREAEKTLLSYHWPGNVRELSNCLERALIFANNELLSQEDLLMHQAQNLKIEHAWQIPPDGISLEAVERHLILSALERTKGNKSRAARLLGLTRDTFRYRLEKHGLI